MKTGKEVKSSHFKDYNVIFGSVNNKHPKAIYINISSWLEPISDDNINYLRIIRNLNKKIKQSVYNLFDKTSNEIFEKERSIIDLDIRESGIKFGKRSFMSCELTLFINMELSVNSEFMKSELTGISDHIIKNVFEKDESFKFHRKKK